MFTYIIFISLTIVSCSGYAEYEIFQGFDATESNANTTVSVHTNMTTVKTIKTTVFNGTKVLQPTKNLATNIISTTLPSVINKGLKARNKIKLKCPEEQSPTNIGSYEVPTPRDLVLLTKHILLKLYYGYNQQSLQLLKDIKESTKAALAVESKCHFNKKMYTECIKTASKRYERFTKDTLINIEVQKSHVSELLENKICNLTDMEHDPLLLIKLLAQEKATLHFALPGFLIMLHSCSLQCSRSNTSSINRKPLRHMTDQDLVVNHFLTKKSYMQLINDSKHKI